MSIMNIADLDSNIRDLASAIQAIGRAQNRCQVAGDAEWLKLNSLRNEVESAKNRAEMALLDAREDAAPNPFERASISAK